MKLNLITAEQPVFSGEVDSITVPGDVGEFQVLPGHTEMIALVKAGELSYQSAGAETRYTVGEGHTEVLDGVVTVAVDSVTLLP